jgi:uncharacterized protein (DUF1330 family)
VFDVAKGYWIAHVNVTDPETYKLYIKANGVAFAKFGGRFLVRAGTAAVVRGALNPRHVVIEFPDYATALACHESEEYRAAAKIRDSASEVDLVIVEGYDGPQPGP